MPHLLNRSQHGLLWCLEVGGQEPARHGGAGGGWRVLPLGMQGWLAAAQGRSTFRESPSSFVTYTYSTVPLSHCCVFFSTRLKFNGKSYVDFKGMEKVTPLTYLGENHVL